MRQILESISETGRHPHHIEGVDQNKFLHNLCLVIDARLVSGIRYRRAMDNEELSFSTSANVSLTKAGHDFLGR